MTVMSSSKVLGSLAKSDLQQHSRTGKQLRSIPGRDRLGSENFIPFISRAANSFHHPVGTCRIGKVVDDTLHVKDIADLRVVDASVMPAIPQAVINAATIAIAERASDLILAT
jgi:choline dehydrogenase-like flavoprotein